MKKSVKILMSLFLFLLVGVVGCEGQDASPSDENSDEFKVVYLVPGQLGDKSFYDMANEGVKKLNEEYGMTTKVIEMGYDETKWEPTLLDVSEQDWDIVLTTGGNIAELLDEVALMFPENHYINFDVNEQPSAENVYGMSYKSNELSFLAGAAAALMSSGTIGFVGGMDNPGINDFLVGYIEGAKYVREDIKVATSYVGDFADPAKGKEISLSQFNSGVDVIFNPAGQSGIGVIDAAKELSKFVIGVDSDQAKMFEETDPEKSNVILTSAVKKIDEAIIRAVLKHQDNTLDYGTLETLGLVEDGVGLALNTQYETLVPEEVRIQIEAITEKLMNNEILVSSAFGLSTTEINTIKASVQP